MDSNYLGLTRKRKQNEMIKYNWQNTIVHDKGDEVIDGRLTELYVPSDGPDKYGIETSLRLVRWHLDSSGYVIDRADLYVVNGKLPKTFWRNGAKVPQRYHDMLARKIKRGK